jgi:hypothetical protein
MDNTPLGEMNLEQIPKDILTNKNGHKSSWAIFLIIIIIIIFGIFWLVEAPVQSLPAPIQQPQESHQSAIPKSPTSDLEASVGAIDIPSYSEEL